MKFHYPLKLRFRLIALAPKISITDAEGNEIFYVEQKVLALKEAVKVYDSSKNKNLLYTMQANQIFDFGAKYIFRTTNGKEVGSVQQEGVRSLFQASYQVFNKNNKAAYQIIQTNPLIAVLDSLISIIPFAELISGFILNPTYSIMNREIKNPILTMKKKPSFFESNFEITKIKDVPEDQELLILLSCLMIVQLEKNRG